MAESSGLTQIVESAVQQALAGHIPTLQAELVQRVLESLPASKPAAPDAGDKGKDGDAGSLLRAITAIHAGTTQKEILRGLLASGSEHCARIALFVVKGGTATGWQSIGFPDDAATKDFSLDVASPPVTHTLQNRAATPANIAEMDSRFIEHFGGPSNEQILLLPLMLKDKVAALVYADGGSAGKMDSAALELIVVTTSAWLEVTSLRKQSMRDAGSEPAVAAAPPAERHAPEAPVQTVSSFSDPFASHSPKHIAPEPPQVAESNPAAEVVEVSTSAHASSAAAPAAAADPFAGLSPEDADIHRKAQRFARLLVDEIKLYNQAKVGEGRKHKDLYDRMKDDIEKSRATFQKRYGNTAAASAPYFQQELVRSLAEDDLSIMGSNFHM